MEHNTAKPRAGVSSIAISGLNCMHAVLQDARATLKQHKKLKEEWSSASAEMRTKDVHACNSKWRAAQRGAPLMSAPSQDTRRSKLPCML